MSAVTGAAGVAFVVAVCLRPDAAIGLVVLGVLFIGLERRFPVRDQPIFRNGFATDAVHFLVDEILASVVLAAGLLLLVPVGRHVVPEIVRAGLEFQPRLLSYLEGLVIAEIAGYWGHRASHEVPGLWRFHRLHHSITVMDWLAPNRRHPVDMAWARASVIVPLLAMGFSVPAIGAHFAIKRFQGLLVHANVKLDAGVLTWVLATPEFHHWHHADHAEAYNKNYAGQLPIVDWLFGTLYLPHPHWPTHYGFGEVPPPGYLAQLAWPFQRPDAPVRSGDDTDRGASYAGAVRLRSGDLARALRSSGGDEGVGAP